MQKSMIYAEMPFGRGLQDLSARSLAQLVGIEKHQERLLLGFDDDRDLGRNVAVQAQRDLVLAQRANRLIELNLAPVHMVLLRFESIGDIFRRYRAEKLVVLSRALPNGQGHVAHQLGE